MQLLSSEAVKKLFLHAAFGAAGFLVSRAEVFGNYAPFGTAIAAAVPFSNLGSVLIGTLLGYLLPPTVNESVRYIAALLACAAIRWTLNDLKKFCSHPLFAPLAALLPILLTGLTMGTVEGFSSEFIVVHLTEALLAAGVAYFFTRTFKLISGSGGISTLSQQELACAVLAAGVLVLSLGQVTVGSVSVGRVLAVLAVLFCAYTGGVVGGSMSGIAAGIVFGLSSPGLSYLSGAYSFGGLMAGIFSGLGRVASAAAFILCNGIVSLQTGDKVTVISGLYEVMAATLIFVVLPKEAGSRLSLLFSARGSYPERDSLCRSVIMRLGFASKALSEVSGTVEAVSEKLHGLCTPDIGNVYSRAVDDICRRCGLKVFCWERERENTEDAVGSLTSALCKKGEIAIEDFPPQFARRCSRIGEFSQSINQNYSEFMIRQAAERRISEVRAVVSDQFSGMSEMLSDLAEEFKEYERLDSAAAERITAVLRSAGILPAEVICRVDRRNRMTVDLEAAEADLFRIKKTGLFREIGKACDRVFEMPCVSSASGCCRITITERAAFSLEAGTAQHVCGKGRLCGDAYEVFSDGCGRSLCIISDGMGTGARAAVDGAMAAGMMARLIKAGFGFDCALRIVNSALAVKSEEESLATLDIVSVDLFSGKAEFRKAGAPFTFLKRQGKVVKLELPSLPAGILPDIRFATETIQLEEDDCILMFSDGAIAAGEDWICEMLKNFKGKNAKELAELAVKEACERRKDGRDDDITVAAFFLKRWKKSF